jgi:hypothetical protein
MPILFLGHHSRYLSCTLDKLEIRLVASLTANHRICDVYKSLLDSILC